MAIYNNGTVAVQKHSAVISGVETHWSTLPGGLFSCAGAAIPIESIEGDTSLTLTYPWPMDSAANAIYAISYRPAQPPLDPGIANFVHALEALSAR